jgi:two-component system nitrogen regulation response regulator GlnG
VKAVQNGAFEYVLKPFDLEEIRGTIRRALIVNEATNNQQPKEQTEGMVGKTPVMQAVFKRIALAASSDAAVLLQGESGVGKATAARAIHRHSARSAGPFVTVNLAGLDAIQAEAKLFGEGNGYARDGHLAEAAGGTLFLEDAAQIPFGVQAKLLRAFESGEIIPIGSEQPVKMDCRLIAASDESLFSKVQTGECRHDLYFRLSAFEIQIPPLRERQADIPLLARHFALKKRGSTVSFAEETINELSSRPWYGNVRELRNAIEHALVVARAGLMLPAHLPAALPMLQTDSTGLGSHETLKELAKQKATDLLDDPKVEGFVYEKFLEELEPALLASAMDRYSNECAPAARALGLHRTTLKRKLDQYGMSK